MVAVRAESLGKAYRLGQLNRRTFFGDIKRRLTGGHALDSSDPSLFWALREINFEIQQGEVVGFLGHNGAGKSTLLKILSQITSPTTGRAYLNGRVASLLEVGTGFHQELSGRENVFLNGTILGMTRAEIGRKFDEIAAFSGIEPFLETPVKRYSSGMRVRLAFAVAAHLEPEIMIIDEVLAVGDAAFQTKCLGKIGEVSRAGRTVLFVSHNAAAIEALCTRGIVLRKGEMVFDGSQIDALAHYASLQAPKASDLRDRPDRIGTGDVRVVKLEIRDEEDREIGQARAGQDVEVWLHFESRGERRFPQLCVRLHFQTELGAPVFCQFNDLTHTDLTHDGELPEKGAFVCRIPRLPLAPNLYRIEYQIRESRRRGQLLDALPSAAELAVEGGNFFGTGELPAARFGSTLVEGEWRLETSTSNAAENTAAEICGTRRGS